MHVGAHNNGLREDLWFVDEETEAQSSSMAHPRSGNVSGGSKGQTQVLLALRRPLYFHRGYQSQYTNDLNVVG